jgi:hypothetical protein
MFSKMFRNVALIITLVPALAIAQDDPAADKDELNKQYKARLTTMIGREVGVRQRYMSMTIGSMQQVCELSDAQQKKLELAAKGAVEKSLTKFQQQWRAVYIQQQKLQAQRQAGVRAAFPRIGAAPQAGGQMAAKEKIWTTTLKQTLTADQRKAWEQEVTKNAAFQRKVMIDLSLSMIGIQVHLVSEQREALAPLIEKQLVGDVSQGNFNVYTKVTREILPKLSQLPEEQIAKILNESQLSAWKEYVGRFAARNPRNAAGVQILAVPAARLVPAQRLQKAE